MQIASATAPRWLGATVLLAASILGAARRTPLRETAPSIELYSARGHRSFGLGFAADGATIITSDFRCRTGRTGGRVCHTFAMIGRLDGDRVVESAREDFLPHADGTFDVKRDTVVLRKPGSPEILVFFTRDGAAWRRVQELEVVSGCRLSTGDYHPAVHLGYHVLIVESDNAAGACIYERQGSRWQLRTRIRQPPDARDAGVSRDRFVVLASDGIYVHDAATGWRPSRVLQPPPGATFDKLALGDRWLVTRAGDRLYVYDLDAARLVTTLPSQVGHDNNFATWFAVNDTTIAATGAADQVWTFDGTAWQPAGLLVGANDKSPPIYRETKIGDVVWIGNPRTGDGRDGGTIHGFQVTR